jgi:hypothetical protein
MLSPRYYREQAQIILSWALAASDPVEASELTARGMEMLAKEAEAYKRGTLDLDWALDEFNSQQLRKT